MLDNTEILNYTTTITKLREVPMTKQEKIQLATYQRKEKENIELNFADRNEYTSLLLKETDDLNKKTLRNVLVSAIIGSSSLVFSVIILLIKLLS